jgi:Zn-dependent protease
VLLAEPQRTPYDLHFQIFGFEIRVSPFFWLLAAVLGWNWSQGYDSVLASYETVLSQAAQLPDVPERFEIQGLVESNPGAGGLLLIWISAVFLSILVHELGHAFAMRYYGIHSSVVLYHFGGLAIPDSTASFAGRGRHSDSQNQIVISIAGPAAQLLLAVLLIGLTQASGYALSGFPFTFGIPFLESVIPLDAGKPISSMPLLALLHFTILPSIFWALLNLLPVYPLDGGQISRELFTIYSRHDGIKNSLLLSVITGGAVAAYFLMNEQTMAAMMFGMLAFSSYQVLQAYSGRGGHGPW